MSPRYIASPSRTLAWYFWMLIVLKCGASTSATARVMPSSTIRPTVSSTHGAQWRMPM